MRVDFMMIGAQKCATTTLARQLAYHPDICFCKIKEPAYFNRTQNWQEGLENYHQLYSPVEGQICGEASTMYTSLPEWQGTHSRLFAYNPNLKLIYIMRQPVERVISGYAHLLLQSAVKDSPKIAVLADPRYINRSRYGVQIRPYLDLFKRENILLLIFEEYIADQLKTLKQIAMFLSVSPDAFQGVDTTLRDNETVGEGELKTPVRQLMTLNLFQAIRLRIPSSIRKTIRPYLANRLDKKPYFLPALKETIWRFVEDDVVTIEGLLGRRLEIWRNGYGD